MSAHRAPWLRALAIGLAFGAVAVHLSVVGVLLMLHKRWIVVDTLSLGQAILVVLSMGAGAMAAARVETGRGARGHLAMGAIAGVASGVPIALLTLAIAFVPLQSIFIALSPDLLDMLTVQQGPALGVVIAVGGATLAGLLGTGLRLIPASYTRPLIPGAVTVLVAGVFQELIQLMLQQYQGIVTDLQDLPSNT